MRRPPPTASTATTASHSWTGRRSQTAGTALPDDGLMHLPHRHPSARPSRRALIPPARAACLAVALVLALAGCAGEGAASDPDTAAPAPTSPAPTAASSSSIPAAGPQPPGVETIEIEGSLDHVHGIVVTDEGTLLLGTHTGVAALTTDGTLTRVGDGRDDHMGMTGIPGTSRLVSSGHPGPASTLPNPVGLLSSDDGGRTWTPVSLVGAVDFHALATDGTRVVGFGRPAGLLVSDDAGASFEAGAPIAAAALAFGGEALYATTADGVQRSSDGGRTFAAVPDAPPLVLLAAGVDGSLWGVDTAGTAWRSVHGEDWEQRGTAGPVEALGVDDLDTAYAVEGQRLHVLT